MQNTFPKYIKVGDGYIIDPNDTTNKVMSDNDWLKQFGIKADKEYPAFIGNQADNSRGLTGADSIGGVFNPEGYSDTQDYLQKIAGFSREQTKGTPLENVSDQAIWSAFNHIDTPAFANDLYYNPQTGGMSSVPSEGSIPVKDIRDTIAKLTGQQNVYNMNLAAPLVQPGEGTQAQRQADLIKRLMTEQTPIGTQTGTPIKPPAEPKPVTPVTDETEKRKKELDLWKLFIAGRS